MPLICKYIENLYLAFFYSANLCRFQSNLFLIVMLTLCRIFLHFSSNSLSFIKKDIHLVSSTFLLFALIFGNIIQKGIIIKIFKAFFYQKEPCQILLFYPRLHDIMKLGSCVFMKFVFSNFNIAKRYIFFTFLYVYKLYYFVMLLSPQFNQHFSAHLLRLFC